MNTLSRAWLFDLASIYGESIENFPADILSIWMETLSPAEQQRANTFTHSQRRIVYIASHALAYWLLEKNFSKTPQQWQIASEGQPLVSNVGTTLNTSTDLPNISLSHSDSWLLCAIADENTRIGCDIETHKTRVNIDAIAKSFFTETEAHLLATLNGAEKERYFYRLWTAKEAWLKAQGLGIANGLKRVQINGNSFSIAGDSTDTDDWQLLVSSQKEYSVAMAIKSMHCGGCYPPYEITSIKWNAIGANFELAQSEVMEIAGASHARDIS